MKVKVTTTITVLFNTTHLWTLSSNKHIYTNVHAHTTCKMHEHRNMAVSNAVASSWASLKCAVWRRHNLVYLDPFFYGNHRATFQKLITFEKWWVSVVLFRCQYVIAVKQISSHFCCSVSCRTFIFFLIFGCSVHPHNIVRTHGTKAKLWHRMHCYRSWVARSTYNFSMLTKCKKKDIVILKFFSKKKFWSKTIKLPETLFEVKISFAE